MRMIRFLDKIIIKYECSEAAIDSYGTENINEDILIAPIEDENSKTNSGKFWDKMNLSQIIYEMVSESYLGELRKFGGVQIIIKSRKIFFITVRGGVFFTVFPYLFIYRRNGGL